jgi:hypothetical protein
MITKETKMHHHHHHQQYKYEKLFIGEDWFSDQCPSSNNTLTHIQDQVLNNMRQALSIILHVRDQLDNTRLCCDLRSIVYRSSSSITPVHSSMLISMSDQSSNDIEMTDQSTSMDATTVLPINTISKEYNELNDDDNHETIAKFDESQSISPVVSDTQSNILEEEYLSQQMYQNSVVSDVIENEKVLSESMDQTSQTDEEILTLSQLNRVEATTSSIYSDLSTDTQIYIPAVENEMIKNLDIDDNGSFLRAYSDSIDIVQEDVVFDSPQTTSAEHIFSPLSDEENDSPLFLSSPQAKSVPFPMFPQFYSTTEYDSEF